jgi:uncharacterized protein YeaO (DUF488 family)
MAIRVVRLGSARAPDEGLRIGAVGCYCADETHCHRSLLRELLIDAGAALAGP